MKTSFVHSVGFLALGLAVVLLVAPASSRAQSYSAPVDIYLTGQTTGTVYGTDSYSVYSDLPTAAVHAGLLAPGQSARIRIMPAGGLSNMPGSTRNGVTSVTRTTYNEVVRLQLTPIDGSWTTLTGTDTSITGVSSGYYLYGTDNYRYDSNLSMAAVHLGLLAVGQTKTLRYMDGPTTAFYGTNRFGVNSSSALADSSFTLVMPPGPPQIASDPYILLTTPASVIKTQPIVVEAVIRDPDNDLVYGGLAVDSTPGNGYSFGGTSSEEFIRKSIDTSSMATGYRTVYVRAKDSRYTGSGTTGLADISAYVNVVDDFAPAVITSVVAHVVALSPARVDITVTASSANTLYNAYIYVNSPTGYTGFTSLASPAFSGNSATYSWYPSGGLIAGARYYIYATASAYNGTWIGSLSLPSPVIAFDAVMEQTISFAAIANRPLSGGAFSVSPSSSSGLTVALAIESGPATLSGTTITPTGYGRVVVRASQAGNSSYRPAADVVRSFIVADSSTLDSDGDGIPDWWEQTYGLNYLNASDATSDADGDGLTAAEEYHLGRLPSSYDGSSGSISVLVHTPANN